jgi:hypothetical protein
LFSAKLIFSFWSLSRVKRGRTQVTSPNTRKQQKTTINFFKNRKTA